MASASRCLLSGALRGVLLCMLMLLPAFTADHGMLVGGWRDRSVSDPDVQDAATVAVNHYNKANNNVFFCRALAILKAQSQVVEGIKYYMKMLLVTTECDKRSKQGSGQLDLGECRVPPRREQQSCHAFGLPTTLCEEVMIALGTRETNVQILCLEPSLAERHTCDEHELWTGYFLNLMTGSH